MAQVTIKGPSSHSQPFNTGDVSDERGWGPKRIVDALNAMLDELYAGIANADAFTATETTVAADRPLVLPAYTAGTLPDPVAGGMIYVTDGAEGSPILAFSDGVGWLRSDTAAAVAGAA